MMDKYDVMDVNRIQAERIKELEADASRYRWLREQCDNGGLTVYGWDLESWSGDNIDAAIDESMMPTIPEVRE